FSESVLIIGNSINGVEGHSGTGINLSDDSVDCKVIGNTIVGTNEGINVGPGSMAAVITGNTSRNTNSVGCVINSASGCLVEGNNFVGVGNSAPGVIRITNAGGLVPTDNSITGNRGRALTSKPGVSL